MRIAKLCGAALVCWACGDSAGEDRGDDPDAGSALDAAAETGSGDAAVSDDGGTPTPTDAGAQDSAAEGGNGDGGLQDAAQPPADGSAPDAGGCPATSSRFVTGTTAHQFGSGQNLGQAQFPQPILGPPRGSGCCSGSLDVVSLGNGGSVTVEFGGNRIIDLPGPDFIVFENAFFAGGDPEKPFAELATVEVSEDGSTWVGFPCMTLSAPYDSCAGVAPVYAHAEDNTLDPLDPAVAGGDAFDLADVGLASARYVRITDRADQEGLAGVFDLDAVGIVHAACP